MITPPKRELFINRQLFLVFETDFSKPEPVCKIYNCYRRKFLTAKLDKLYFFQIENIAIKYGQQIPPDDGYFEQNDECIQVEPVFNESTETSYTKTVKPEVGFLHVVEYFKYGQPCSIDEAQIVLVRNNVTKTYDLLDRSELTIKTQLKIEL